MAPEDGLRRVPSSRVCEGSRPETAYRLPARELPGGKAIDMCGIAGWVRMTPEMPDVSRLTRMCDVLKHRGPDDAGVFVSRDGRVGLGNRRLSIIDLSPRGHQPMANESGTVWITYN